jgi:hypothetical protein
MGKQRSLIIAMLLAIAGASLGAAQTSDSSASTAKVEENNQSAEVQGDLKSSQSMFFALDEGQAMTGRDDHSSYGIVKRLWQEKMFFHFTNDIAFKERLRLILSIECGLTFSYRQDNTLPSTLTPLFNFYPNDVEMNYSFGNLQKPWLQVAAGYFPFKYDPDVKHFGEYLLRSTAYPTFIVSNFEFAMTRELGFHASGYMDWLLGNPAIDQLKWDVMLTSETNSWPLQDWSLTGMISNTLFNFLDVGAGVSFQRILPVDDSKTNIKIKNPSPSGNIFFSENGDTGYYSFQATKLMGRASINPQRFIPEFKLPFPQFFGNKPFFGKEDLKVYGEIAVLGLKDYVAYDSILHVIRYHDTVDEFNNPIRVIDSSVWLWGKAPKDTSVHSKNGQNNIYDSLADRMPFMIGINLPTNPIISYSILPFILTKWLKDETGDDIRPLAWITLLPGLASGVAQYYLGWDFGLDELSLEFEWMSQRFPNSNFLAENFSGSSKPLPIEVSNGGRQSFGITAERVKYALYFKKSFLKRFAISGLVARDHMRPPVHGPASLSVNDDFLQEKSDWWWTFRLSASF